MFAKLILIAVFLFIFLSTVLGQGVVGGVYSFNQDINKMSKISERERGDCYLYFLPNKKYFLEITLRLASDLFSDCTISVGSYADSNNYLVLRDDINKFNLTLKKNGDTGYFINGFYGLINKKFLFEEIPSSSDSLLPREPQTIKILDDANNDRKSYKLKNTTPIKLFFGLYSGFRYNLRILRNNRYSLNFGGLTISKGHWSRDGNELVLYDNYLKCRFYMLICKNSLISKLIPGDTFGLTFVRQKKY